MNLKRSLAYAAAAMTLVGGSVLALGAHTFNEETEAEEVAAAAQNAGVVKDAADGKTNADVGTENYWRGGGRGYGYGGRSWGWGGRSWGRAWGYRGGRWGYWGPAYYGY